MGERVVIWQKKAKTAFNNQLFWYYLNTNKQFAATFFRNITETVSRISKMPSIGQLEKEDEKRIYRSFPSHPKCRILYWYNDTEIHIVDLLFAASNH